MVKRSIIKIDEEKCDGCSLCIPNCPEGAIQIIDNKARLISDLFCDGLGACIGHCPQEAITIEEREAIPYDELKVMENIVKQGENTIKAHLEHLRDHNEQELLEQALDYLKENNIENPLKNAKQDTPLPCGCPGTSLREIKRNNSQNQTQQSTQQESSLTQWPVQLHLLPPSAQFFNNSDLLVCADCVPFAHPNFHSQLLSGKSLVIGCPKLDDIQAYEEKLTEILKINNIKSIAVPIMEVPCCYGLFAAVESAVKNSGKDIPVEKKVISINGEELKSQPF